MGAKENLVFVSNSFQIKIRTPQLTKILSHSEK